VIPILLLRKSNWLPFRLVTLGLALGGGGEPDKMVK
jgi:hypothetical protein